MSASTRIIGFTATRKIKYQISAEYITIKLISFYSKLSHKSTYPICMQRLTLGNNFTQGFPHKSSSTEISFCSPSNSDKECAQKCSTYQDSYTIGEYQTSSNEFRRKRVLNRIRHLAATNLTTFPHNFLVPYRITHMVYDISHIYVIGKLHDDITSSTFWPILYYDYPVKHYIKALGLYHAQITFCTQSKKTWQQNKKNRQ